MIAKVITSASTREEVLACMERALSEMVTEGIATTIPFHERLLRDPNFRVGRYDTAFVELMKEAEGAGPDAERQAAREVAESLGETTEARSQ